MSQVADFECIKVLKIASNVFLGKYMDKTWVEWSQMVQRYHRQWSEA